MAADVIVLNGGSSAGKTEIARLLQAILPDAWLTLGVDDLIRAMPNRLLAGGEGLLIEAGGRVLPGPAFRDLEQAWMAGIVAMARAGARVIVDDVFLDAAETQARWRRALAHQEVVWAGVRCAPEVAALRELARGDRARGMAVAQAAIVHDGVHYDIEVDTSETSALACAREIAAAVAAAALPGQSP
jgi:chloramphenicol 3-O phosphotransferase